MKEHPIIFSTQMVQALLEGRKTQTRRIIKTPPFYSGFYITKTPTGKLIEVIAHDEHGLTERSDGSQRYILYPYGKPGDLLWVREAWCEYYDPNGAPYDPLIAYKADGVDAGKWRPSIHMPKSAARIWLQVKEIRVERLHDISEEDAIQEGIETLPYKQYGNPIYRVYPHQLGTRWPRDSFVSLWKNIHGKPTINLNHGKPTIKIHRR